jgi:hypothetical protein
VFCNRINLVRPEGCDLHHARLSLWYYTGRLSLLRTEITRISSWLTQFPARYEEDSNYPVNAPRRSHRVWAALGAQGLFLFFPTRLLLSEIKYAGERSLSPLRSCNKRRISAACPTTALRDKRFPTFNDATLQTPARLHIYKNPMVSIYHCAGNQGGGRTLCVILI